MDVAWIQLGLTSGVLGVLIIGTFYFWHQELLNALPLEEKDERKTTG